MRFALPLSVIVAAVSSSFVSAADTGLVSYLAKFTGSSYTGKYPLNTLISLVSSESKIFEALSTTTGPITVFAPTDNAFTNFLAANPKFDPKNLDALADVLLYHVAPTVFVPSAPRAFIDTLRPDALTAPRNTVLRADFDSKAVKLSFGLGSATVVFSSPELTLSNGKTSGKAIVHFIDTVLVPPTDAATTASAVPDLSSLVKAVVATKLVDAINTSKNITILAPVNAAFDAISSLTSTLTVDQISSVLTFHVIPGVFYSTDLIAAGAKLDGVPTLFGKNTLTESNDGKSKIQIAGPSNKTPANVVIADVLIANGVVHVIDSVLLPSLESLGLGTPSTTTTKTTSSAYTSTTTTTTPSTTTTSTTSKITYGTSSTQLLYSGGERTSAVTIMGLASAFMAAVFLF